MDNIRAGWKNLYSFQSQGTSHSVALSTASGMAASRFLVFDSAEMEGWSPEEPGSFFEYYEKLPRERRSAHKLAQAKTEFVPVHVFGNATDRAIYCHLSYF
jgi:hypothetical protein